MAPLRPTSRSLPRVLRLMPGNQRRNGNRVWRSGRRMARIGDGPQAAPPYSLAAVNSKSRLHGSQAVAAVAGGDALQPAIEYLWIGLDPGLDCCIVAGLLAQHLIHDAVLHVLGEAQVGEQPGNVRTLRGIAFARQGVDLATVAEILLAALEVLHVVLNVHRVRRPDEKHHELLEL